MARGERAARVAVESSRAHECGDSQRELNANVEHGLLLHSSGRAYRMSMVASAKRGTSKRFCCCPDDGNRYEVVDGELLVTPNPDVRHEVASVELFQRLNGYVRREHIGTLFVARGDVFFRGTGRYVQPDLFLVPLGTEQLPSAWRDVGTPTLVVEIISPSTARADRVIKRRAYQDEGVSEYWIVDLDARLIERWRPGDDRGELSSTMLEWNPAGASAPLSIDLADYFGRIPRG